MTVFLSIFFLIYVDGSKFMGILLYLLMFLFFLGGFGLMGVDLFKGEIYGMVGFDYISFFLIMLLLWVSALVLVLFYDWLLCIFLIFLMLMMGLMFSSMDLVYLYICFESSMLPMFLIIMYFGEYKERYSASMYMFIYTMVSSLPMFVVLFVLMGWVGSGGIDYMMYNLQGLDLWVSFIIIIMFLVKVPVFLLHIWLPKAHVEAPVFGSMILASVMLKMGGYGVIRCLDIMTMDVLFSDFFFCFCLCGGLFISYSCLFQVDLKVLVAYSSIIHMGTMLAGFFSGSELGYLGGIIMMLSHGICSSGMFYLVNEMYMISGSRLLMLNGGFFGGGPILLWAWLGMLISNLGVPPCFGILGELLLISGCLLYCSWIFMIFFFMIFFISCFVINMYSSLLGGQFLFRFGNVFLTTYYGVVFHLIPINLFIFFISVCF